MLSDGTWTYTWEQGRQLKTMTDGTTNLSFSYDEEGKRVSKTVGNTTWKYVYNGSNLVYMTDGTNYLYFHYDATGASGFTYNNTPYYYLKNAQGDVIGIANSTGTVVTEYSYDAWGNPVTTTDNEIGQLNPIRYRGYYYDTETGLYYVSSRYYDSEVGRWISPEPNVYAGAFDSGSGLLAYNAYAYCANNPVNFSDPTGEFLLSTLIVGAIVGAAIGFAATAYVDYKDDGQVFNGSVDAKSYVANTLVGGIVGGFTGGVGSSTFSLTIPTIQAAMTTAGSTVLVAGTTTVTVAGAEIVAGTAAVGLGIMASIIGKSGGYTVKKFPNDHDPEHVHIYGDDISDKAHGIRIGLDGKPLPGQNKLPPGAKKALKKLWKLVLESFIS